MVGAEDSDTGFGDTLEATRPGRWGASVLVAPSLNSISADGLLWRILRKTRASASEVLAPSRAIDAPPPGAAEQGRVPAQDLHVRRARALKARRAFLN